MVHKARLYGWDYMDNKDVPALTVNVFSYNPACELCVVSASPSDTAAILDSEDGRAEKNKVSKRI